MKTSYRRKPDESHKITKARIAARRRTVETKLIRSLKENRRNIRVTDILDAMKAEAIQ